jgi:hypothetical protein
MPPPMWPPRAFDGIYHTLGDAHCALSDLRPDPYIMIDLGDTYTVQRVEITKSSNVAHDEQLKAFNFYIVVVGASCTTYNQFDVSARLRRRCSWGSRSEGCTGRASSLRGPLPTARSWGACGTAGSVAVAACPYLALPRWCRPHAQYSTFDTSVMCGFGNTLAPGDTGSFDCKGILGRYVFVYAPTCRPCGSLCRLDRTPGSQRSARL